MLVEDDNNLREIYEARLLAEGYEIVSAHDGEEALALAVKEKPDLIIADVMMPKISGFDMLDILRSTPESKDTKVIMMTALSQAEDKARADKLGADRYLVKSQVTLEDVAKIAREVLEESGASSAAGTPATGVPVDSPTPDPMSAPMDTPVDMPATDLTSQPVATPPADNPVNDLPAPAPITTDSSGPTTMTFDPSAVPGPTAPASDQPMVVTPAEPVAAPEPVQTSSQPVVPEPASAPAPVSIPVTVVEEPVATPPETPNETPAPAPVSVAPAPEPQPAAQVITPTVTQDTPASDAPKPADPNLISL